MELRGDATDKENRSGSDGWEPGVFAAGAGSANKSVVSGDKKYLSCMTTKEIALGDSTQQN
jgi:hypothetical protein